MPERAKLSLDGSLEPGEVLTERGAFSSMTCFTVDCIKDAKLRGRRLLSLLGLDTPTKMPRRFPDRLGLAGAADCCPIFVSAVLALARTFLSRSLRAALFNAAIAPLRIFLIFLLGRLPVLYWRRCPSDEAEIRRMVEELSLPRALLSAAVARGSFDLAKLRTADILAFELLPVDRRLARVFILSADAVAGTDTDSVTRSKVQNIQRNIESHSISCDLCQQAKSRVKMIAYI